MSNSPIFSQQRFKQVFLFFSSSILRNFVGLLLGLIATPWVLKFLGEEKYGAWLTLLDWFGHLGLLEFGLFASMLPIFSKSLSTKSRLTPSRVAREGFFKYAQVIGLQILAAFILSFFIQKLIPVGEELKKDLLVAYIFVSLTIGFGFTNIFKAYLIASHEGYRVSLTMLVQNLLATSGALLAAYLGSGISGQALAYFLALAGSGFVLFLFSRKGLNSIFSNTRKVRHFNLVLKQQRIPNFVSQVCGNVSLLTDRIIVAAFMGPAAVASFYLTQRLILISMQQLQQIGNTTWATMSELYYQGKKDLFNIRLLRVTEFISCFASCGLCVLVLFNQSFVTLWVGADRFVSLELSNIIIFNAGLVGINTFWHWCFSGTGMVVKLLPMLIAQATVNFVVSLSGAYAIGFYGPPLGTAISFTLITQPWTTYLLSKHFGVSKWSLTKAWVPPFVIPVLFTIGIVEYFGSPQVETWGMLILYIFLALGLTFSTFPFIFLNSVSRNYLFAKVFSVLRLGFLVNRSRGQ